MIANVQELVSFLEQDNLVIVLDSSAILDIYKHDQSHSSNLLKAYQLNQNKIWLPKHVDYEVDENYFSVRASRKDGLKNMPRDLSKTLVKFRKGVSSVLKNPVKFKYPTAVDINSLLENKINEIEEILSEHKDRVTTMDEEELSDVIKDFLTELRQSNQIGDGYDEFDKLAIYSEGVFRYKLGIAPGFKDIKKDKNDLTGTQKFGDLIIWKEVLSHIKDMQAPLLFITSDVKEDWWELDDNDRIIRQRMSLVREFEKYTELERDKFEMLSTGMFFNYMLGTIDFVNQDYYKTLELIATNYSLNLIDKFEDILSCEEIASDYLEEELELEWELSNEHFPMMIEEEFESIELTDIPYNEIIDIRFENDEDYFTFNVELEALCKVKTTHTVYDEHEINYEYDVNITYYIILNVPVNEKDFIDLEDLEDSVYTEENLLNKCDYEAEYIFDEIVYVEKTKDPFAEIKERCTKCKVREGVYHTHDYELICSECSNYMTLCPDCGLFFEKGFIGAFCEGCESNH